MARPGKKRKTALFIVEILCLLLFIGGLYVYGQIDSRLNKIETPQLDESKNCYECDGTADDRLYHICAFCN